MFKKNTTKPSVEALEICFPKIIIDKDALRKMHIYIDECEDEIGWLGTVVKENGYYYISDVLLFEQEVHSTTTEITPEGLSTFGEKLLAQEDGMDIWNSIKLWGHSHVNMSVFASGQDDSQMEVFADNGHDFFIRIIANKKGEMKLDLYEYTTGVIYKNLDWFVNPTVEEQNVAEQMASLEELMAELQKEADKLNDVALAKMETEIKAEMATKVRKKVTVVKNYGSESKRRWDVKLQKYVDMEEKQIVKQKDHQTGEDMVVIDGVTVEAELFAELAYCNSMEEANELFISYGYSRGDFTMEDINILLYEAWNMPIEESVGYNNARYLY